ncbi:hypothetical protein [Tolypothrix sp. VBCCA 56010]|uniref:hypothetical protein n=1 Tax=Tolypothrix sp. VBCCA 56010 TaxID=3137731 RepID=UPI003D7C6DBB
MSSSNFITRDVDGTGHGDKETRRTILSPLSPSPHLPISPSPHLPISPSQELCLTKTSIVAHIKMAHIEKYTCLLFIE